MPYNPGGIFSLIASYFAEAGTTIRTEQHNPVFEDVAAALSQAVLRDGRAGMTGPLNMNGFAINNVATGNTPTSVATLAQAMPIGAIIDFAGSSAPAGWMLCYGQSLSRATYAALFTVIQTAYGAVDGNSFSLPDLRGRVAAGPDAMGGTPANRLVSTYFGPVATLGAGGGDQGITINSSQMPYHNHGGTTFPMNSNQNVSHNVLGFQQVPAAFGDQFLAAAYTQGSARSVVTDTRNIDHLHGILGEGGGQPHANVQPTLILNKIIRVSYDV